MHHSKCDCLVCTGDIAPGKPLPVRKILRNILLNYSQGHGKDLRFKGFYPRLLTLICHRDITLDNKKLTLEVHADKQSDLWEVWVLNSPPNTFFFKGDNLSGYSWQKENSMGVLAKDGVLSIHNKHGAILDLLLD